MRAVAASSGLARTRVVRAGFAALVLTLVLGGGLMSLTAGTTSSAAAAPMPTATVSTGLAPEAAGPTALPVASGSASPQVITTDTMAPGTVLIPSAGIYISYALEPVINGEATVPDCTAGIWDKGATPTDKAGTVLLWGHVDTSHCRTGAFAGLASTVPNGAIYLKDADGHVTSWQVTQMYTEPRSSKHAELFTTAGPHRLAVVTCGGAPTTDGYYTHNVIVIAQETASQQA